MTMKQTINEALMENNIFAAWSLGVYDIHQNCSENNRKTEN